MSDTEKISREFATMKGALFALAGVCLLLLTETLRQEKLDRPLTIATYCFVIAMPWLIGFAICIDSSSESTFRDMSWAMIQMFMAGWSGAYVGVAGITSFLWHFSRAFAWVF